MVLDGLRDAISGMTESIESSQAVIASYQGLIVEEAHGVEICRRSETVTPSDDDVIPKPDILQFPLTVMLKC